MEKGWRQESGRRPLHYLSRLLKQGTDLRQYTAHMLVRKEKRKKIGGRAI